MTTPAQDAPLVLPSVVFRPGRLSALCAALTVAATALGALAGHAAFGLFFGVGLGLGLVNALLVRRSVTAITAEAHPLKHKMALNSATRLLVVTTIGLAIAFLFRPLGVGVLFGLAMFQVCLVLSTALPVWKKIRAADPGAAPADGAHPSPASPLADNMFKD